MSRCELSGKGPVVKNLVSHSNVKIKSRALPNIQSKRMFSESLKEFVRFKVATSTLRTVEHLGGLDQFILNQSDAHLSKRAQTLKTRIRRKLRLQKAKG